MALAVPVAQLIATVTLNLALAAVVGVIVSCLWLAGRGAPWASAQRGRLRLASAAAVAVALLASGAPLWLEAAEMAEVPLIEAGAAVRSMLTATHFGPAWLAGAAALLLGALASAIGLRREDERRWVFVPLSALAVFRYTRSMVSHSASEGDFGIRILVDWTHLVLMSVWVGEVLVAGSLTLAAPPAARADDHIDCKGYFEALSTTATCALIGVVVTGIVNAWYHLRIPDSLTGNTRSGQSIGFW
jgi:putative copper resistance protein D